MTSTGSDAAAARGPREPARVIAVLIVVILLGWTAWAAARGLPFGDIETYGGHTFDLTDSPVLLSATGEPMPEALTILGVTVDALLPLGVFVPAYALLLVLLALAPGWRIVEKAVLAALPVAGIGVTLALTAYSDWVTPLVIVVLLGAGAVWAVRRVARRV